MSPGEVTRLDLRLRRRSILAYSLGMAAYAVLIVALYPTFQHDTSLDSLMSGSPTLSAAFGIAGSLTTSSGWMNANIYANFLPLLTLAMTIGYGAASLAGQAEDGTLGGMLALPSTRGRLLVEKVLALTVLCLPLPLVTLAAAATGPGFDLQLRTSALVGTTVAVALMALDFGLLALAVGAWTGHRASALGVATAAAALGYVLSALAPVVGWIHALRFLSPFYWSVGADQLQRGPGVGHTLALVGVAVVLVACAVPGFRRLDVP